MPYLGRSPYATCRPEVHVMKADMLTTILRRLFRANGPSSHGNGSDSVAERVYGSIVAQARQPAFYAQCGVPDTPTGRFEMIVAHAALVFRRFNACGEQEAGQAVFDLFFADMDRSLRELGVGDLSVPKHIKKMGQAFYGRAGAYARALNGGNEAALREAVAANLLATSPDRDAVELNAARIAAYLASVQGVLTATDPARILAGEIDWPGAPDGTSREEPDA